MLGKIFYIWFTIFIVFGVSASDASALCANPVDSFIVKSEVVRRGGSYGVNVTLHNCSNESLSIWDSNLPWADSDHIVGWGYYLDDNKTLSWVAGVGHGGSGKIILKPDESISGDFFFRNLLAARIAKNIDETICRKGLVFFWSYEIKPYNRSRQVIGGWGVIRPTTRPK